MSSRLAPFFTLLAVLAGCDEQPFPKVKNVSELEPDERVVIGQIQYGNGDITEWVTGSFRRSWPWFSYDLRHLYGPRGFDSTLGPSGGVFAVRVKRGPAYLHSIAVETKGILKPTTQWNFPVVLKLPDTPERCTFAGTIVVRVSGSPPEDLPWYALPGYTKDGGSHAKALVYDTYDRDRAALAARVGGCDLKKALADDPPPEELEALLRAAAKAAAKEKREAEAAAAYSTP